MLPTAASLRTRSTAVDRPLRSYQDLKVWQAGMQLVLTSYRLSSRFPKHESFGLTSQIRRAAVSVPANIAEGYGRSHRGDYVRYMSVANGSLKELETELMIASHLGYVAEAEHNQVMRQADELGRMLGRLIRMLRKESSHPTP
jgi:four helix bundle protein